MGIHHYSIEKISYQKMTITESNMNNNKNTFHVTFCTWNVFLFSKWKCIRLYNFSENESVKKEMGE